MSELDEGGGGITSYGAVKLGDGAFTPLKI